MVAQARRRGDAQGTRLTSGADHSHSPGRSWGTYFAFASPVDLTGEGSIGRQVYVFSQLDYACQQGRPELRPPTEIESSGRPLPPCPNPKRPFLVKATSALPADEVDNPSVNVDGNVVAFEAYGRFNNTFGGTTGERRQIFVANLATGEVPITGDSPGDSVKPSLNEKDGDGLESTARCSAASRIRRFAVLDPVGAAWQITHGPVQQPMLNRIGATLLQSGQRRRDGTQHLADLLVRQDDRSDVQMTDGNAQPQPVPRRAPPGQVYSSPTPRISRAAGGCTQVIAPLTRRATFISNSCLTGRLHEPRCRSGRRRLSSAPIS
jgi:hypothetical protein